jgi:hypothetical protein
LLLRARAAPDEKLFAFCGAERELNPCFFSTGSAEFELSMEILILSIAVPVPPTDITLWATFVI